MVVGAAGCQLARALGDALSAVVVDPEGVEACAAAARIVIARSALASPLLDAMTLDEFKAILKADIDDPWHIVRAALAGRAGPDRAIVHAFQVAPASLALTSGAELMLRSAARDAGSCEPPVRVNGVHASAEVDFAELVATIAFLLSDDSRFMTGVTLRLGLPN